LGPTFGFLKEFGGMLKLLGLIRDLKIFVHGIPYTITFIVINNNVLNSSYFYVVRMPMVERC
jgi:hypothetical protein